MGKSYFFLGLAPARRDDIHVTRGTDYMVTGGLSKEHHQQMVEVTEEVSKECRKDPPQTRGEFNMVVRDAVKKVSPRSRV